MKRYSKIGYLAAVFLALCAPGCGTSRYARQVEEDRRISLEASAALTRLAGTRLEARCHRGVIALLGSVREEAERARAQSAVEALSGVVRVNNLILVVGNEPAEAAAAPAAGVPLIARAHPASAP